MRVAVLSPVWFPVPPTGYGGIEWVVALLADGLVEAGHDVTLFASGDSRTKARLVSVYEEAPSDRIGTSLAELRHALACYERAGEFDVVNDHSGMPAAALAGTVETPDGPHRSRAAGRRGRGRSTSRSLGWFPESASSRCRSTSAGRSRTSPGLRTARTRSIWTPIPCSRTAGDYLLFLGRLSPDKGCHRAIEVAKETGLPLKIAGKMRDPLEKEYFESTVRPSLGWGIEYLGEVTHENKVDLLQNARATLFPIEWEEPFGLVMIESMACGTPVVATRYGAVPEVIEPGRSGIIVDSFRDMAAAIEAADAIEPLACRAYVEERFSSERMVADYVAAYELMISRAGLPASSPA